MKKIVVLGALLLLGTFTLFAQNVPTIEIVNNTGTFLQYVYISDSESDNWGKDVLKDDVVFPRRSVIIPLSKNGTWDILVVDDNGEEYTFFEVKIPATGKIIVE